MKIRSDRIFHRYVVAVIALVAFVTTTPGDAYGDAPKVAGDKDKWLLSEVRLPQDPRREPYEEYYHRFLIRTKQGQTFIAAYWRQDGSYLAVMLDIFTIERTPKGPEGRLLHTEGLGGEVFVFHVLDLDEDGLDDLLFVHKTGGMIATTGVTLLLHKPTGFSNAFFTAGSDISIYRDRGQLRILVKAPTPKKVEEFSWNHSKKIFELTATFDLLY